ncbi:uncharacterized protein LOC110713262 [Chenopodium quinoa]|uniref:uncharacterized protein LOC110713262 n=1 Tax=Chenopodium quinoa TaxID=63459 RepID=UPI000B770165|nr:uncharacterized protein LOC110713262 [Chenopodium quinoa]
MIICSWNVRGLNDPGRVTNVKRLLRNHSIEVIGLLETKVKQGKFKILQKKFGLSWSWVDNYSYSQKGRIWVGWNSDVLNLDVLTVMSSLFNVQKALWTGIQNLRLQQNPWICVGDFNSVLCSDDRINGNPVSDYEVRDFQGFVDIMEFCEIKSKGPFYSWSDKAHEGPRTCTRIDRGLVNQRWLDIYGHVQALYLNPALSDHSPILIELCSAPSSQGRPFRFLNYVAKHDQFQNTVRDAWGNVVTGNAMLRVWNKLKNVKSKIKDLHLKHFAKIAERLEAALVDLDSIQNNITVNTDNPELQLKETEAISQVKYWTGIQESIYKQKSRVEWVKLGDANNHYFFSMMKQRHSRNRINSIYNEKDVLIRDPSQVVAEEFFDTGIMQRHWNCTTITLVPKVSNSSYVKEFRPIACCTVLYKLISKVITTRLAQVIGEVVDDAQAGFIPGKHIGDNIFLATELIKGYSHRFITPRCILKIDLKKAYDSLEWSFLRAVMEEMSFPKHFIDWVMGCITSVSFSILLNGFPSVPFDKFSKASGLSAILDENEVFFGGGSEDEQQILRDALGVSQGNLPFRYLGVPLSSKKLTINQCRPLVEKVTARITSWTARHLSYAGRIQLVKGVLFGIQTYWAQIFILPKKILKELEARFRSFLWTGTSNFSRRALVAWDTVCLPKVSGGWNVLSLPIWNKAGVTKLLWDLSHKADNLWVKWFHIYYFKGRDCWDFPIPMKCSWVLRKNLQCREVVDSVGGWGNFVQGTVMKIRKLYAFLRPQSQKVDWRRLVCNNRATPKSVFILLLVLWNRLVTKDRLLTWNIHCDPICLLCLQKAETVQHLLFECSYAHKVWKDVLKIQHYNRQILHIADEIKWLMKNCKAKKGLLIMGFAETVYNIWIQRNSVVFNGVCKPAEIAVRDIVFNMACRCYESDYALLVS